MHETRKSLAEWCIDVLVNYRWILACFLFVATAILAFFVGGVARDPSMRSGIDTTSEAYHQYQNFVNHFGNEEFILIVLNQSRQADEPETLKSVQAITKGLAGLDKVTEVVSLTNLKIFKQREGRFGVYPVVTMSDGRPALPKEEEWNSLRKALPVMDFLVSKDLSTVGFLVRTEEADRFEIPAIETVLNEASSIVQRNMLPGAQYRIVGPQVLRLAVHRYNLQTAVVFGILCLVIATAVSSYIFKTVKVAVMTYVIVGIVVVWILAFMSLSEIPLTSTTGLSFGLVLVVSLATTIRIVTHFNERYQIVQNRMEAMRQALGVVLVPCLICSTTTAVGFGTTMVSTIPMVFQLGLIMSLGVMLSFLVSVLVSTALLTSMRPINPRSYERMAGDFVAQMLARMKEAVFNHYRLVTAVGLVFTATMVAGVHLVRSDTQILRMLSSSTQEIKDLQFVEERLTAVHSLELLIEAQEGTFKSTDAWKKVAELDEKLQRIPEVVSTDSFLPLLKHLQDSLGDSSGSENNLFSNPALLPQLLMLTSMSSEGRRLTSRYLDDGSGRLHISVRIKNSPSIPIIDTIEAVRSTAESVMDGHGRITVTGDISVFAAQASALVRSQLRSLSLALILITGLLIVNLRSVRLGLVSLIPNIPPVALIFGIMGWTGISLDTVTVFAASVALGLAVDDTVHFLSQLKLEMRGQRENAPIELCVRRAFDVTAKAMLSTTAVLFFAFLVLVVSPFRPVVSFGILGAASVLAAFLSDVIFMPSVILASPTVRRLMKKEMISGS
jgi:predicted RND superfamily exporter protein